MAQPIFDEVAEDVAPAGVIAAAPVTFRGYLGPTEPQSDMIRVYTDPWFDEYYEFDKDDLLSQIPGTDFHDGRGSAVWVKASARITKHQMGSARKFAEEELLSGDDPAGGGSGSSSSTKKP